MKSKKKGKTDTKLWMVSVNDGEVWLEIYFLKEKVARKYFEAFIGTKVQPKEVPVKIEVFSSQSPKKYFLLEKRGKVGKEITDIRFF